MSRVFPLNTLILSRDAQSNLQKVGFRYAQPNLQKWVGWVGDFPTQQSYKSISAQPNQKKEIIKKSDWWFSNPTYKELEEYFDQLKGLLLPGQAVGDAFRAAETLSIIQIPLVVAQQGVLVGILRLEVQYLLGFLDGHKGIFGSGLIDPWIERR